MLKHLVVMHILYFFPFSSWKIVFVAHNLPAAQLVFSSKVSFREKFEISGYEMEMMMKLKQFFFFHAQTSHFVCICYNTSSVDVLPSEARLSHQGKGNVEDFKRWCDSSRQDKGLEILEMSRKRRRIVSLISWTIERRNSRRKFILKMRLFSLLVVVRPNGSLWPSEILSQG